MVLLELLKYTLDMGRLIAAVGVILAVAAAIYFSGCCNSEPEEIPPEVDGWFGRGSKKPDTDKSIRPFKVEVKQDVLDDLQRRLNNTRLGEDLENTEFQYGFQVTYMKEVIEYWKKKFDWRKQEKIINQFPHFKTTIEGIKIHFIHVKPSKSQPRRRVLLMSHGWPGSIWEFYKILPMLTNPGEFGGKDEEAFEVICPSIPGYGFSEAPHQPGFNAWATARIYRKLMERLGHTRFYYQGGDWGGLIGITLAQLYPQNIIGVHLNMFSTRQQHAPTFLKNVIGNYFPSLLGLDAQDYAKSFPLSEKLLHLLKITGYFHLQATKPDTVAFALNDSPVGLAAYILEKFSGWTDVNNENLLDGGLTEKYTLDELLTNVMIYWVTDSIGPSMRYYRENIGSSAMRSLDRLLITVPTGLADFPNEMVRFPRVLLESRFTNILQYTTFPRGGHFAAFEEPSLLAQDVFRFVEKVESR